MNRIALIALFATTLFSLGLTAHSPDPSTTPTPAPSPTPVVAASPTPSPTPDQDPDVPDRTQVICGGTMNFASSDSGATHDSNIGNIFKLQPVAGAADKRLQTSGVVTLQDNHEFAFSLTAIPRASGLVAGEDLMTMTVRYQRHDGDQIKVLAEGIFTSDQISSFSELNARRSDITISSQLVNSEVSTVLANMGGRATIAEALRTGKLADGVTTMGSFNCRMHVGRSLLFR